MQDNISMQPPSGEDQVAAAHWLDTRPQAAIASRTIKEYFRLTKPRITLLIGISTAVGYCYGTVRHFNSSTFVHALLGTVLMAAGAATLNQWFERDIDAKMKRTKRRPIPAGTVHPAHALVFGVVLSTLGTVDLRIFTNRLATVLGLLTTIAYLFAYTPLKRKHPVCTTIGALPGAMPPLIGFAAASGGLNLKAWLLFGILFFWQFPHFHAIACIYREDYERAGIKMLAVLQPYGSALVREIMTALVLLVPVTLAPAFLHMEGMVYFVAALALDLAFLYFGYRMSRDRNRARARTLLLSSVIYLPVLFAFLVFDRRFAALAAP